MLVQGLDERRYYMRWVPRRKGGNWTAANRERARRLAEAGRMTEAGMATMPDDLRSELAP